MDKEVREQRESKLYLKLTKVNLNLDFILFFEFRFHCVLSITVINSRLNHLT